MKYTDLDKAMMNPKELAELEARKYNAIERHNARVGGIFEVEDKLDKIEEYSSEVPLVLAMRISQLKGLADRELELDAEMNKLAERRKEIVEYVKVGMLEDRRGRSPEEALRVVRARFDELPGLAKEFGFTMI